MVIVREAPKGGHLVPTLGLFSTVMLIVGSMIGSGIFRLPSTMLAKVHDPGLLLLVWVVGGFFTVCGALTFAELAGMFPRAGGQYVFLKESMGTKWAFLYGWAFFWVVMTGIIAAVAVIFADFTLRLFDVPKASKDAWRPVIAVGCVLFLSAVNYFGVKFGGLVQNVFTVAKFVALVALIGLGFSLGHPDHSVVGQSMEPVALQGDTYNQPVGLLLGVAFVLAMLQGFFALDGWPQAAYVASEIKDPTRNVPRGMILGVAMVTVVYVLATAVYVFLLSRPEILAIAQAKGVIAAEAARAFSGETGAKMISAAVMVSTFGTVNAYVLTSPRIFYALSKDGLFWSPFAKVHATWNTPNMAIVFQGLWASFIVLLASFSNDTYTVVVESVVFGIWLFYIPTIIGYFRLRRTRPDAPRPYRTPLYPVIPALFLLAAVAVVCTLLVTNVYTLFRCDNFHSCTDPLGNESGVADLSGLWGTLLISTGLLVLGFWKWKARRGTPNPTDLSAAPE